MVPAISRFIGIPTDPSQTNLNGARNMDPCRTYQLRYCTDGDAVIRVSYSFWKLKCRPICMKHSNIFNYEMRNIIQC